MGEVTRGARTGPARTEEKATRHSWRPLQWGNSLEGDPKAPRSCASISKLLEILTANITRELEHGEQGVQVAHTEQAPPRHNRPHAFAPLTPQRRTPPAGSAGTTMGGGQERQDGHLLLQPAADVPSSSGHAPRSDLQGCRTLGPL